VDIAQEGDEAVQVARQSPYQVILINLQMPGVDGLEATRRIRMLPGGSGTYIVALTGNVFAEDKAACLAAGMDDFLAKPVKVAAIFKTLLRGLLL
jgi:CheY-like chemotaxis protein